MHNTITNRTLANGKRELQSVSGPRAVEAFRLRVIILALKFRLETGQEMSRFSSLKVAKTTTGLRTNNIPRLILALQALQDDAVSDCEIVNR